MENFSTLIENSKRAVRYWWLLLIIGIALFVVGILVFVYPTQSYLGMSLLFGWLMLISGILEVVLSSVNKHFRKRTLRREIVTPYLLPQFPVLRFYRCKERCANIRRRSEAKHCSSLCSQSEGDEYCGGQTRLKIQQSHGPERWPYSLRVRGPHFASKVSYNAGAATDDCAGQR